eukprot:747593-Hanusia_phi.AAC.7
MLHQIVDDFVREQREHVSLLESKLHQTKSEFIDFQDQIEKIASENKEVEAKFNLMQSNIEMCAIRIERGGDMTIADCRVRSADSSGVCAGPLARVWIQDSIVEGCGMHGVVAHNGGQVKMTSSVVRHCKGHGVYSVYCDRDYSSDAHAALSVGHELVRTGGMPTQSFGKPAVYAESCSLHTNLLNGVMACHGGGARLVDCSIASNSRHGVQSAGEDSLVSLDRTCVSANGGAGLHVIEQSSCSARDSSLLANRAEGLKVDGMHTEVQMKGGSIAHNSKQGVHVMGGSMAALHGMEVASNNHSNFLVQVKVIGMCCVTFSYSARRWWGFKRDWNV